MEIRVKFVGGPRDKKSVSYKGKLPAVIRCEETARFYNVRGHYARPEVPEGVQLEKVNYHWVAE